MSVLSTHLSSSHTFSKLPQRSITLVQGLGVKGDAHAGKKTQHEYYIKVDRRKGALRDNIRQVHLIQSELFDEEGFCGEDGQRLYPGQMGENITTVGVDLLALGKGARLRFVEAVADQSKVLDTIIANGTLLSRLIRTSVFAVIQYSASVGTGVLLLLRLSLVFCSFALHISTGKVLGGKSQWSNFQAVEDPVIRSTIISEED